MKNLYVMDFHGPGNLEHSLVQKALDIGVFHRKTTNINQNADVAPEFIQGVAFSRFRGAVFH